MKSKIKSLFFLIVVCNFFYVQHVAAGSLETKLDKLNSQSIDIVGIPITLLIEVLGIQTSSIYIPKDRYESEHIKEKYQRLNAQGYLVINENVATRELLFPGEKASDFVEVKLTEKGLRLRKAFDNLLNTQNGLLPLHK